MDGLTMEMSNVIIEETQAFTVWKLLCLLALMNASLLAIDKTGLGTQERTVVEASLHHTKAGRSEQAGSLGALSRIDAGQRPDKDDCMEFGAGSDTLASI